MALQKNQKKGVPIPPPPRRPATRSGAANGVPYMQPMSAELGSWSPRASECA